jgi:phosphatidylglycerophosphatase A
MSLDRALATGLGLGYAPPVPGTLGSLLGAALCVLLHRAGGWPWALGGFVVVCLFGFWSAGRLERQLGTRDPGCIVIDEVAGQMLTLLLVPLSAGLVAAGFLLFRMLDILKPFPARRAEALAGSSGIMADDLIAGLWANLLLQALVRWVAWPAGKG